MRYLKIPCFVLALLILASWAGISPASDLPAESHPSILYDSSMVPTILDRIGRPPYSIWWQNVHSMAIQGLNFNFSGATETQKSHYCKYLAFAYVITDSLPFAQKCLEGLQLINPAGNWGAELHNQADPMNCYCEAYDVLKGSGFTFGSSETQIRAHIAQKAQEFRDNYAILLYVNNWRVRYLSALGLAAMTLADYPSAEDWHDYAESMVANVFNNCQVVGEGAWAEGPYYLLYSADIYMPYMLAFHRLITGADFINEPSVRATHDWSWEIRLPNGQRPNFEDSHLSYFYGDFLATVYDSAGLYQWDYLTVPGSAGLFAIDHWQVDAICYFDDAIQPAPPQINPTIFMPEAGNLILRTGWGFDHIYFFLIGEHGSARIYGQGHDHPDATSFILYAYGEMLCLDAGYISWSQRGAVNKARNHSLILVDGLGPPTSTSIAAGDADAYLKNFYNIGSLQFCDDSTYYRNVSMKRSVLFVDSSFFLIRDRIAGSAVHTYDWRLHGNGGGTSGGSFSLSSNGAAWSRTGATLHAVVTAADVISDAARIITWSATIDTHSFAYNQILTHQTLNAQVMGRNVDFLAAVYPVPAGVAPPALERLLCSDEIALKVGSGVAASSGGAAAMYLPYEISGYADIETDADWFYAGIENGEIALQDLHQSSQFTFGDTDYFGASQPLTMALDRRGYFWQGYVSGAGTYSVDLYVGELLPLQVTFNGNAASFTYGSSMIHIALTGSGYLEIQLGPSLAVSCDASDYPQSLDWSRSCHLSAAPNPFNPGTVISFEVPQSGAVLLTIYDLQGREIARLQDGFLARGQYFSSFDASALPSGVYFARIAGSGFQATEKLLLLK